VVDYWQCLYHGVVPLRNAVALGQAAEVLKVQRGLEVIRKLEDTIRTHEKTLAERDCELVRSRGVGAACVELYVCLGRVAMM
jgi:hypothetical protein